MCGEEMDDTGIVADLAQVVSQMYNEEQMHSRCGQKTYSLDEVCERVRFYRECREQGATINVDFTKPQTERQDTQESREQPDDLAEII